MRTSCCAWGFLYDDGHSMREAYRRVDDSKGGFGGAEGFRLSAWVCSFLMCVWMEFKSGNSKYWKMLALSILVLSHQCKCADSSDIDRFWLAELLTWIKRMYSLNLLKSSKNLNLLTRCRDFCSRATMGVFRFWESSCNHSALVQESTDGVPTNCHQKLPTWPGRPGASQVDFVEVVIHENLRESWLI